MSSGDPTPAFPSDLTASGLTCEIYLLHTSPNEEISDDVLRRAFLTSVNGTERQWRAFVKLLRVMGATR